MGQTTEPRAPELRIYNWMTDEFILVDWYSKLITSGEHYRTFASDLRHLSSFLDYFKPPRTLAIAVDEQGIWFAFWLESAMSGAFFGLWIREDKRHTPSALRLLKEAFDGSFEFAAVLIAYTKQEHLRGALERLGCTFLGTIPALWDGDAVDVYTLTKDDWESRYGDRKKQRERIE